MMNTFSRFSVLSPDINLDNAFKVKTKKTKSNIPKENGFKPEPKIIKAAPKVVKKKKTDETDLQAMAFGKVKGSKKSATQKQTSSKEIKTKDKKKNKGTKTNGTENIDEQWKKIDEEFIQKENEEALREAIIQSKLDYEEKKKTKVEKPIEEEKESISKVSKTKKRKDKPLTISLDQFNSLDPKQLANLKKDPSLVNEKPNSEPVRDGLQKFDEEKFFKDVEELTRKTLEKEKRQEQYKNNANKLNNEIQIKKFKSEIEKRDFEIQALRLEVESLRTQLTDVKGRNKKLCDVISCSEMRSKGELVVELDKTMKGRDEFSEEVTRLNIELEQERTKVSNLTNDLKKIQGKKRNPDK